MREIRSVEYTRGEKSCLRGAKNLTVPYPCSGLKPSLPPLLLHARLLKPPPTIRQLYGVDHYHIVQLLCHHRKPSLDAYF